MATGEVTIPVVENIEGKAEATDNWKEKVASDRCSNSEATVENHDTRWGSFLQMWKKIFVVSCLFAVALDPLFLYIPMMKDDIKCLLSDRNLKTAVLLLRSLTDLFYILDIIFQIYTPAKYPQNDDISVKKEAKMWVFFCFVDILAILPLPQVAIFIFFSKMRDLRSLSTKRMAVMNFFVLFQYVPRVLRIYLLCKEVKRTPKGETGEIAIWVKCFLNFFLYILASHVLGAVWYFFAIQRMTICWHDACRKEKRCDTSTFGCHEHHTFRNITFLNDLCPTSAVNTTRFDFGIYITVLQSGIMGSTNYFQKFSNCFWWGLRNLSSLGSNLEPSVDGWENLFAAFISIIGLLLFLYLIGNLQMYMQLETAATETHRYKMKMKQMKVEQRMEEKGRETELWLSKNGIPRRLNKDIKPQIMKKVRQELEENRDADLDYIFSSLPFYLQSQFTSYMPMAMLKKVPMFRNVDEIVLKATCEYLRPKEYIKDDIITREGEKLKMMLFIVDGLVTIEQRDGSPNNLQQRGGGEVCGKELLDWPFPDELPLALESATAIGDVEALVLMASDLKIVVDRFLMQYILNKKSQMEEKGRDAESWLSKNGIPKRLHKDMKLKMMNKVRQELQENGDADMDKIFSILPLNLQSQIKSYMPMTRLKQVPTLQNMDERVLRRICQYLEPREFDDNSIIIEKGEPLEMMLFIVEGNVSIEKGNGSSSSNDNLQQRPRGAGEVCGEELLRWPLWVLYLRNVLLLATESAKAIGHVEALVLTAGDFRKVVKMDYFVGMMRRTFSAKELAKATDNYHQSRIIREDADATFYKGVLPMPDDDKTVVAVKKLDTSFDYGEIAMGEAAVASQTNHINAVRFLGGCVEERKEYALVFEYIPNGTLFEHIHKEEAAGSFEGSSLRQSLELRLKIASETAGALAYLHSLTPPIIHLCLSSKHILLDDHYTAKLSAIGYSRQQSWRLDFHYLHSKGVYFDPNFKIDRLAEKSDVYSFGVILAELLTSQRPASPDSEGEEPPLVTRFLSSMEEGRLDQILDAQIIVNEATSETAKKVADLAKRCLRSKREERPSMEQVAVELAEYQRGERTQFLKQTNLFATVNNSNKQKLLSPAV